MQGQRRAIKPAHEKSGLQGRPDDQG